MWPAWAGPEREAPSPRPPADPWLKNEEPFEGGTALEDLALAGDAAAAARVLAVFVIARLTLSFVRPPPGFAADIERAAARSWLGLLPETDPDRLTLTRLVETAAGAGLPDSDFTRGIERAAAAAVQRSCLNTAFSLLEAAYAVHRVGGRQADAAVLARRLAGVAVEAGSSAAARRWNLRAASHERRAAAEGSEDVR